jgi:CRISPR/Cas system CSM-associated protein Csm2 small subunit
MPEGIELPEDFGKDQPEWVKEATKGIDIGVAFAQGKRQTAKEVYDFLQRYLYARPDQEWAKIKYKDWEKLWKKLIKINPELKS